MGERYVLDGDVFQQTTYPTVPGRMIPKDLDVAATILGSGRARVHLSDELDGIFVIFQRAFVWR